MNKIHSLVGVFLLMYSQATISQVSGSVLDTEASPLPYVNIYWEGTNQGTITNSEGYFKIGQNKEAKALIFKFLGFETVRVPTQEIATNNHLKIVLKSQNLILNEVELTAEENPAIRVIKAAISRKETHQKEIESYQADFYSKGFIQINKAPEKILGQEVGDFEGSLDSTRSGVVYLSETVSKISKFNNDFKEFIIASKVAGDAQGISFNNASDVDYNFYDNTLLFGSNIVSPIANNAFAYYRYKLLGTFYDEQGRMINQIKVIPRRKDDKVFSGEISIVEESWAIYGLRLKITGLQAKVLPADTITLSQEYNYNEEYKTWLKALQRIDFGYNIFGFKGDGNFTAAYSNYNLNPEYDKKDFGNELIAFDENASKKKDTYWEEARPVPLTTNESTNYQKKDSIGVLRSSRVYLDSIDKEKNKLSYSNILGSYTKENSFEKKKWTIETPFANTSYNTVQGWNGGFNFSTTKLNDTLGTYRDFTIHTNYGLSEKRFRTDLSYFYRFNNQSRPYIILSAGRQLLQFNRNNPIKPFGNALITLFFESNYAKFFERDFASIDFGKEILRGITFNGQLAYEQRNPVFNTTDYAFIKTDQNRFTSNNPLSPFGFDNAAFMPHNLWKLDVKFRIRFNEKYLSYPDGRWNYSDDSYPTLMVGYEQGFGASENASNYAVFRGRIFQNFRIGEKGRFSYNLKGGKFINGEDITFVDYQHFNGNRTDVTRLGYLNTFFILPYYDRSTNDAYFEGHLQHNFEGYIMNKIPLLNKLKAHLILNANTLATPAEKPYHELGISLGNLGLNKFRFLRVGFAKSWFDGTSEETINFGISF